MELRGKAFYNLLKAKWVDDHSAHVKPWQVEDYRKLALNEFFKRLENFAIIIDEAAFLLYAEKCDAPEELTECLTAETLDEEHYGQVYLLIFELWRRLCPKKQTLSIFCDELDHLIDLYDDDQIENLDLIADHLLELSAILDEHIDNGEEADQIYELVNSFIAHDLESFIYDFVSNLIDVEQTMSASKIVDAFYPYVEDKRWLEFLTIRLLSETEKEEAKLMMDRLFEELQEDPDIELGFEMLRFLIALDERRAFQVLLDQVSSWVQTEEDFQQLLCLVSDYFEVLDLSEQKEQLSKLMHRRKDKSLDEKFFPTNREMQDLKNLVRIEFTTP